MERRRLPIGQPGSLQFPSGRGVMRGLPKKIEPIKNSSMKILHHRR